MSFNNRHHDYGIKNYHHVKAKRGKSRKSTHEILCGFGRLLDLRACLRGGCRAARRATPSVPGTAGCSARAPAPRAPSARPCGSGRWSSGCCPPGEASSCFGASPSRPGS